MDEACKRNEKNKNNYSFLREKKETEYVFVRLAKITVQCILTSMLGEDGMD